MEKSSIIMDGKHYDIYEGTIETRKGIRIFEVDELNKKTEVIFLKFQNLVNLYEEIISEIDDPELFLLEVEKLEELLFKKIDELELSVRSTHCLKYEGIVYIRDLVQKSEWEMLSIGNFGRKSLNEIKEVLSQMGLTLGMEVSPVEHAMRPFLQTMKSKLQSVLEAIERKEKDSEC